VDEIGTLRQTLGKLCVYVSRTISEIQGGKCSMLPKFVVTSWIIRPAFGMSCSRSCNIRLTKELISIDPALTPMTHPRLRLK